jgi:hypothetical protein
MARSKWSAEEERRAEKLAQGDRGVVKKGQEAFHQLLEVTESDPGEQIKVRAQEARFNYEHALHELRRMEDEKRNDRLEEIASSNRGGTWVAVLVALASLVASLHALKR